MLARDQLYVHLGVLNMKQLHPYQCINKCVCHFGSAVLMHCAVAIPFLHRTYLRPVLCTVPLSFTEKEWVGQCVPLPRFMKLYQ